jgi:hypothetical protein
MFDGREMKDGFRNLQKLQKLTLSGVPWILVSGRAVPTFRLQELLDFERLFPSLQTLALGTWGVVTETLLGPRRIFKLNVSQRVWESAKGATIHRSTGFIVINLCPRPLLSPLPRRHQPEASVTAPGYCSSHRCVPFWEMQERSGAEEQFERVAAMIPPPPLTSANEAKKETQV